MSIHLALLVIGGVLAAVAGDWLGHRLGRRRISLFRLRPRYSGLLGTGVAGGFVGLLAGLGLWGIGAVGTAPEPAIVTVVIPDPAVAAKTSLPAAAPADAKPAPVVRGPDPVTVPVAPSPLTMQPAGDTRLQEAERRIRDLTRQLAERPAPAPATPPVELVTRRGEVLGLVEAAGGKSAEGAHRAVAQVLGLVERIGIRRGAGSGLKIPAEQMEAVAKGLQGAGAYRLQIVAAQHSALGEPLVVQLSLEPQPVASLAEMQERDRLDGHRSGSLATAERVLAPMASSGRLEDLPPTEYVTLPETAADPSLQVGWHDDLVMGGPIRLQIGADE